MKNDGGPAFPRPASETDTYGSGVEQEGMSLRDYFAGQMLAAIGRSPNRPTEAAAETGWWSRVAADCYAMADAMIEARRAAARRLDALVGRESDLPERLRPS